MKTKTKQLILLLFIMFVAIRPFPNRPWREADLPKPDRLHPWWSFVCGINDELICTTRSIDVRK